MVKKITLLFIILCTVSSVSAQMMLEPVATVNLIRSQMISREQLDAKIEELSAASGSQDLNEREVLEVMINDALVLQGAERDGIVLRDQELTALVAEQKKSVESQLGRSLSDADFASVLDQAYGLSMTDFRQKIKENYIVNSYIRQAKSDMISDVPAPSSAEITAFYRKNASSFINSELVKISHIFISKNTSLNSDPQDKASQVLRQLQMGSSTFEELVLSQSQDEETKFVGGELGWFAIDDDQSRNEYGDGFIDAVFDLEADDVSGVIESKLGFHIVKALEHIYPRLLTLDDRLSPENRMTVRQYITQMLYVEKQQEVYEQAVSDLVRELRQEADIRILL
jgi:parvulin-like peptidyl-prolyl isomerase